MTKDKSPKGKPPREELPKDFLRVVDSVLKPNKKR